MLFTRKKTKPGLNSRLKRSGWFRRGIGPFGWCPVQLFGQLVSGEYVYFRARGRTASLEILEHPAKQPIKTFTRDVEIDHELGAGAMPKHMAVALIETWLTEYTGRAPKQKEEGMSRLAQWWSSLEDRTLLGVLCSFATTGGCRFFIDRKVDMFHNGDKPVPGIVIQVGRLQLHLSSAKRWEH